VNRGAFAQYHRVSAYLPVHGRTRFDLDTPRHVHIPVDVARHNHVACFNVTHYSTTSSDNERGRAVESALDTTVNPHGPVGIYFTANCQAVVDYRIAGRLPRGALSEQFHRKPLQLRRADRWINVTQIAFRLGTPLVPDRHIIDAAGPRRVNRIRVERAVTQSTLHLSAFPDL
jgi:hypothetical protein